MARHGMAGFGRRGKAGQGPAWRGWPVEARRGKARQGLVGRVGAGSSIQWSMVMQEYRYRPGSRFNVPAQVVGEAIASIEAVDGQVTPAAFVERARPEGSPIHPLIEWNVDVAAAKYQL